MNVVIITGSNRQGSTSTKLSRYIAAVLTSQGIKAEVYDLHEHPVPFYSPDEDHSGDANLSRLRNMLQQAQGIVLSTPEYHGSISGVLKNALDHLGSHEFSDKPVLSVSSAGGAVGVSSLQHLQTMVRNLHGINCPEWISIGGEQRQFTESGEPANLNVRNRVTRVLTYFIGLVEKLNESSVLDAMDRPYRQ
jgi:azobenzene reductase